MTRWLIDENLSPVWRRALLDCCPTLTICRIGDPGCPPFKSPDSNILDWCERNNFLLLTDNRDSMPGHLIDHLTKGGHIPGIVNIDIRVSMGENVALIELMINASFPSEFIDRVVRLSEL